VHQFVFFYVGCVILQDMSVIWKWKFEKKIHPRPYFLAGCNRKHQNF